MQTHQGVIEHDLVAARGRFQNDRLRKDLYELITVKRTALGHALGLRGLFGSHQGKTRVPHNDGTVEKRRRARGLGLRSSLWNDVVPIRLERILPGHGRIVRRGG